MQSRRRGGEGDGTLFHFSLGHVHGWVRGEGVVFCYVPRKDVRNICVRVFFFRIVLTAECGAWGNP